MEKDKYRSHSERSGADENRSSDRPKLLKKADVEKRDGGRSYGSGNSDRGNRDYSKGYSSSRGSNDSRGGYGSKREGSDSRGGYGSRREDGESRSFNSNRGNRGDFKARNEAGRPFNADRPKVVKKPMSARDEEYSKKVIFRKRKPKTDDEQREKKHFEAYKKEVDLTKPIRLNKFLANAGICSRREADTYIQAGIVTVNDEPVTELGAKVLPTDKVMFHNQTIRSERKVYIVLNKPKDYVTTVEDTHDRKIVMDLVKNACSERIYPVGRLDKNTTGILLFTNDGDLAAKLMHPKFEKKKIYQVTLDKELSQEDFDKIKEGLDLEDGIIKPDDLAYVKEEDKKQIGIEIHSGKNRIVRRIFDKLGYYVVKLDRVYFAGLTKKNLARGKYRFLTAREIRDLQEM